MLYLVSLGDLEDKGLFVWDWNCPSPQEKRLSSNKLGKPVYNIAFSDPGHPQEFFVTAGFDHLKVWAMGE